MSTVYDLNKLLAFARKEGVSLEISYAEGDDSLSVEVYSGAESENFYQKRVISSEHFIASWYKHMGRHPIQPPEPEPPTK